MSANTLFLRLEGPLQAWGDQESKFSVRRTTPAPTKSGVIGLLCAALGVDRSIAADGTLARLNTLRMGVRTDRPGVRWWDYHTVGAGLHMRIAEAEAKTKPGAMLSRREYLCDASFFVAMRGDTELIGELAAALSTPRWPYYLGRKSCPPSRPVAEHPAAEFPDLETALKSVPWRRRLAGDGTPDSVDCHIEWNPTTTQPTAPYDADIWYDVPVSFDVPSHRPRFVLRRILTVGAGRDIAVDSEPAQKTTPTPPRTHADYRNTEYRKAREARLKSDEGLCVFCKSPAGTVQHITYRHAGGDEAQEELRSLCRLCHDAVTMIEYGLGMGMDRINPEEPRWREAIADKRSEIIRFRSLETRRRRLSPEEVE